ncbi:hypothetical protein SAMN05421747_12511 [Parapedobacter composti]|uniref:Uncharacterized protein n=1 Tax=Parapedobacter composti TaxID=623281 RepID=A0A1I1M3J7_9SPHI|nr:hypothetical protein [Parapedobacter composti]SFC77778.1 hypothetical protein SAMN05421747_12511 [Parapedobacter composti]
MLKHLTYLLLATSLLAACKHTSEINGTPVAQRQLARIDAMPELPQPLEIIDWHGLAEAYDSIVYDFNARGDHWPLIWWDSTGRNFEQPTVGIYTAMGDARQGPHNHNGMFHESLATMGGVLGATLVGIDKSRQNGLNYVGMLRNYFNRENRWNIMMNNTAPEVALLGGGYGRDWWYDVYPNVLFYAIVDRYPEEPGFDTLARRIAEQFYRADSVLEGNYSHTFFNYAEMRPESNWICAQEDAAAGHAWVLYAAYRKFGDERYLTAAKRAQQALHAQPENRFYEILMPFGAYTAARMNAEQGTDFDVKQILQWTFDGTSVCREGWGVLVDHWNGFDVSGLVGSTVDHGGYGFLMNTFDTALPLVPLVRYDQSFASAIGKWMLNAANATRLFYPQHIPAKHQTIPELAAATKGVIGYEGLVKESTFDEYKHIPAPVAQGDGPKWVPGKNPPVSQFSVYGSAHVGIFGSIIRPTDVDGILQLDLLATDFFRDEAYPSYLCYNPYEEAREVTVTLPRGNGEWDVYDAVQARFVSRTSSGGGNARVTVPAGGAAVLVVVPAGAEIRQEGQKLLAGDVVIDYRFNGKQQ